MARERAGTGGRPIRVVVGEDSPLMQTLIVDALQSDPAIQVVGRGGDGREVLRLVSELRPDCVTLDLEMPNMDGLETLRYLMSEWPTPVVIVSAHTAESAEIALACLEYGAVDIVPKTWGGNRFAARELAAKVKEAATIDVRRQRFARSEIAIGSKPRTAFAPELGASVALAAQRDALARETAKVLPNGVTTYHSYDAASEVTGIVHQGPAGVLQSLGYTKRSVFGTQTMEAGGRGSCARTRPNPRAMLIPMRLDASEPGIWQVLSAAVQCTSTTASATLDGDTADEEGR